LKPGPAKLQDEVNPRGRTWFVKNQLHVQYLGAAGFLIKQTGMPDEYRSDINDVVAIFVAQT
jgi:hypothetical protein